MVIWPIGVGRGEIMDITKRKQSQMETSNIMSDTQLVFNKL